MLGLSQDGKECLGHTFDEGNIIMKRPYLLFTLLEFLDNGKNIRFGENIGKQLLSTCTKEQLILISYIDRELVDYMINPDKLWIKKLQHSDIENEEIPASDELI